jgi:hypothetical protein
MRWIIERLFGWDQAREEENFLGFFKLDEVRIITAGARDVGWIQERPEGASILSWFVVRDAGDAAARHRHPGSPDASGASQEPIENRHSSRC